MTLATAPRPAGGTETGKAKATRRIAPAVRRKAARLAAVQALYQIDLTGAAPEVVMNEFLEHRLGEEIEGIRLGDLDRELFASLIKEISAEIGPLDDILTAVLAEGWPVERLERLLKVILRAGAYEMAYRPEVPARVIITEYVDLAHAFFGGKEPGMANGVLDRLAHSLRPEEFPAAPGAGPGRGAREAG